MVKIELRKFVFLFLVILLISLVASVAVVGKPSSSIDKSYGPSDNIKGWINISLTNQQRNATIQSSFGQSIKLMDLLKDGLNKNSFSYTCNPTTCTSDYSSSNGETIKNFALTNNGSVLVGFLINGKSVSDAYDFSLYFESNNPESEELPLLLDILDDGQIDWVAYNSSNNFGEEKPGCYKGVVGETKLATVASDVSHQYCEKIELSVTPSVEIGAYVLGTGAAEFTMGIKGINEGNYKPCIATATGSGLQRISCSPDYMVGGGDYFVCIRKNNGATYQINYETKNVCGFTGSYNNQYQNDYNVFARQSKFASSINFTLNNAELIKSNSHTENIEEDINDYITNRYRNNCTNGCIIPIRIYYNVGQNIKISNSQLSYYSSGVLLTGTVTKVYDIQELPPQINAKAQKLYLDNASFTVPANYGNYTFSLTLEGNKFFSDNISVGKIPTITSLTPTTTAISYPTKFIVKASSAEGIVKYNWDFGDGKKQNTTTNEISYTYSTIGNYDLTVTVFDKKGKSAIKIFNVYIAPASEVTPGLLEEADTNIAMIKSQISELSQFEEESVSNALNLDVAQETIDNLKILIETADSEEDYETILGELLEIRLPETIAITASTNEIIFYPQESNINLDVLAEATGETYDSSKEGAYKQAILAWDEANMGSNVVFNEISATYNGDESPLVKTFSLHVTKGYNDAYLVIKDMENLLFEDDYLEEELEGYYYIELTQPEEYITFSTTDDVDFITLPAFVSPAMSELVLAEWSPFLADGGMKKWVLFTIIIAIVLFVTFIVWIILQWWYKVKYENHLFKDRNNLYNLVNYIGNEKKKGTKEGEIIAKLRKVGWNSEQLRYAVKKYDNKNTGMLEIIPLDKVVNKNKKTDVQKK